MANERSVITNGPGGLRSCDGPDAVEAFRLRALITMLDFRAKTGADLDRRVPAIKVARQITGLKTRDLASLRHAVDLLLRDTIARCEIRTEPAPAGARPVENR